MDAFSLIIGGMLGGLAGWAFSNATLKQREANKRSTEVLKTKEKMSRMEGETKSNKERRVAELVQGFLLYAFGIIIIAILTAMMFNALI